MLLEQEEVVRRVARGAALLDRLQPGWDEKIDLSDLDMGLDGAGPRCVICQLTGNRFWAGCRQVFSNLMVDGDRMLIEHGLYIYPPIIGVADDEHFRPNYALLTAEWTALIQARRAAARRSEVPCGEAVPQTC